jgi:GTP cyclohydrolase IV
VDERLAPAPDLQASAPEVRIGLSRAGVTGVQKAVRMQHGGHDALVSAEIDCFVDLDPAQKGVHMSRFPELFEEAIDEVVIDGKLLVENLAEHIARHIVERQQALRAEVKIAARYPIERLTPVTGLRTQELVTLIGLAAASRTGARRIVGVEATGSMLAPARKDSSASRRRSVSAKPASTSPTSSGSSSSSRWRRTTSAAGGLSTSGQRPGWTPRTSLPWWSNP